MKLGERLTVCRNGHDRAPDNLYTYTNKAGKTYGYCRACRMETRTARRAQMRDYMVQRRYGITRGERSAILVSQDGLCAICYDRFATVVDHDHATGRIRGMLCKGCNTALGVIGDNVEALENVIGYLATEKAVA